MDNYWCHSAILSTRRPVVADAADVIDGSSASDAAAQTAAADGLGPSAGPMQAAPQDAALSPTERRHIDHRRQKLDARARLRRALMGARSRVFKNYPSVRGEEAATASPPAAAAPPAAAVVDAATAGAAAEGVAAVDLPGTSFITLFCDDQKVPLPTTIVDILSKQGEKLVPDSISSLHEVARGVEKERQRLREAGLVVASSSSAPAGGAGIGGAGAAAGADDNGAGEGGASREDAVAPTGFARRGAGNLPSPTPERSRIEDLFERGLSGPASPPF